MTAQRFMVLLVASLVLAMGYYVFLLTMRTYLPGGGTFDFLAHAMPIILLFVYFFVMGAFNKATATHYKVFSALASVTVPYVVMAVLFLGVCMFDRICL